MIDDKSSVCGEEGEKKGEKEDVGSNDAENMREGDIGNMKVLSLVPYKFKMMFVCVCVCNLYVYLHMHVHGCVCMHV